MADKSTSAFIPPEGSKKGQYRAVLCAGGLLGSLVAYGVFQERIMTLPYGREGENFTFSLFAVLCNRLVTVVVAGAVRLYKGEPFTPTAPHHAYAIVSVTNISSTTLQFEALKYVSFPVQTLVKSAKMIPVMLWGTTMLKKKYRPSDFLVALLVMGGVTCFLLSGDTAAPRHSEAPPAGAYVKGPLLLVAYLALDGFTSTSQDKLFRQHNMSFLEQTFFMNLWAALLSLAGLLARGLLAPALAFVAKHPACLADLLLLSLTATSIQFLISVIIGDYGALVCALIQTCRQMVSILLSCLLFVHPLTAGQLAATVVVFGPLLWRSFTASSAKEKGAKA